MHLSRIVVKNYRSLESVDVKIAEQATCIIGENNTGKSNLIHALRLCLDVNLSSSYRSLLSHDINSNVDRSNPFQVFVGVEFTGFKGHDNEEAMLHGTQIDSNRARLFYRFRPKRLIREGLSRGEMEPALLNLEDYSWELVGGGNPAIDMKDISWDTENEEIGASHVGLQYLQSYLVVFLPALRDVESDLQQMRRSPLARLIDASEIALHEQDALVGAVKTANDTIENSPTIKGIAEAVDNSFKQITGPAFSMGVELGLSDPSFQSIIRSINVLLSNDSLKSFEPNRNGLGLNNILYISILVEYFQKRAALGKSAGELILIEEPESHLHPQLQLTLLDALRELPFQSILTTHSTHVTSKAPLDSFVFLTNRGTSSPYASVLADNSALDIGDVNDLERYLDATKSNLLFARKVMLVEGPAELFLIPPLVKQVMGVDLEREGISVIAIHGVHFAPFTRLFSEHGLPKKCAIVADADLTSVEAAAAEADEDEPSKPDIAALEGNFVKAFLGATTFEREFTTEKNLAFITKATKELGAPKITKDLEKATSIGTVDDEIKNKVLRTAKRFGKARFAQVLTRHIKDAKEIPPYIRNAVEWLLL